MQVQRLKNRPIHFQTVCEAASPEFGLSLYYICVFCQFISARHLFIVVLGLVFIMLCVFSSKQLLATM